MEECIKTVEKAVSNGVRGLSKIRQFDQRKTKKECKSTPFYFGVPANRKICGVLFWNVFLVELRQVIAMGGDKLVDHAFNGINVKLGGGVRIHHRGLIDMFLFAGYCRLDGQKMHVDIAHIHRRALYGQGADVDGVNTGTVCDAGHLNTGDGSLCYLKFPNNIKTYPS